MTTTRRIETLDDLTSYLHGLFGPDIVPSVMNHYEVMFTVDGKVRKVMAALQENTGREGWDGDTSFWFYRNDALNVGIGLASAPGCVMVMATIDSLHREALRPYGS